MNKIGKGFKWAQREHRWEERTIKVTCICLVIVVLAYYYNVYPAEFGLISVVLISITHMIARICHKMEQYCFKNVRHPKK